MNFIFIFLFVLLTFSNVHSSMDVVFFTKQTIYNTYFIHVAELSSDNQLKLLTLNPTTSKLEIKLVNEDSLCEEKNAFFARENVWETKEEVESVIAQYPSLDSTCDRILNNLKNGPGNVAICTQQQLYKAEYNTLTRNGTVTKSFLNTDKQLYFSKTKSSTIMKLSPDSIIYLPDSWWTNAVVVGNKMTFSWVIPSIYVNAFINVDENNALTLVEIPPGNRVISTTRWAARFTNRCFG